MAFDIADLIRAAGLDPHRVTFEQVLALVDGEARMFCGRAMAAVKLGKAEKLVTLAEARAALAEPETPGDDILSGRTLRAGEDAYFHVLVERGLLDRQIVGRRLKTNHDLDNGETTVMARPVPTRKRPSGRPARSADFARFLAIDVEYRFASGEAVSREKVLEHLIGRDRLGNRIAGPAPMLVLPNGRNSWRTLTALLRQARRDSPGLIETAREQGELIRGGATPDPAFMGDLMQMRAILTNRQAVKSMLRAARR